MSQGSSFDELVEHAKSQSSSPSSSDFPPLSPEEEATLKRAAQMITDSTPKPHLSWAERTKAAGLFIVLLIGGVGGGVSLAHVLSYFGFSDLLQGIICLVFWCAYMMLISKIELKSDAKSSYERGYSDGYATGESEGLMKGVSVKQL